MKQLRNPVIKEQPIMDTTTPQPARNNPLAASMPSDVTQLTESAAERLRAALDRPAPTNKSIREVTQIGSRLSVLSCPA